MGISQDEDVIGRLITGVVVAVFTATVTWWIKGNEAHDSELADRIDDAVVELTEIEKLSIDIWGGVANSGTPKQPINEAPLASLMVMEGRLHRLAMLIDFVGMRVSNFPGYKTDFLLSDLRAACTSDGLGSDELTLISSPLRIKTILIRSTKMMLKLREVRRDVLPRGWLARLLRLSRLQSTAHTIRERKYWDH